MAKPQSTLLKRIPVVLLHSIYSFLDIVTHLQLLETCKYALHVSNVKNSWKKTVSLEGLQIQEKKFERVIKYLRKKASRLYVTDSNPLFPKLKCNNPKYIVIYEQLMREHMKNDVRLLLNDGLLVNNTFVDHNSLSLQLRPISFVALNSCCVDPGFVQLLITKEEITHAAFRDCSFRWTNPMQGCDQRPRLRALFLCVQKKAQLFHYMCIGDMTNLTDYIILNVNKQSYILRNRKACDAFSSSDSIQMEWARDPISVLFDGFHACLPLVCHCGRTHVSHVSCSRSVWMQ